MLIRLEPTPKWIENYFEKIKLAETRTLVTNHLIDKCIK